MEVIMIKLTRLLSVILVIVMLATALVACAGDQGDENSNGGTTTPGGNATTPGGTPGPETDENGYLKDDLPEGKIDDEIYLFTWENQLGWEFEATSLTGDTVKDEVYRRKERLEDTYGITLKIDKANGDWDHRNEFVNIVQANQSEEGDNIWDIVGCYFAVSGAMTVKGFFADLSNETEFPHLDLSKPWWPDDLLGTARVNNAVYAITGDITPTFIRNMSMCHVNLDMLEQYNMGVNIYDIVENKEWTYEKLAQLALNKVAGEGVEREYALTMGSNVSFDNILYSSGYTLVNNLDDGSLELAPLGTDQKFIDFYTYIYELFTQHKDVNGALAIGATPNPDTGVGAGFQAGNVMFNFGSAADVQNNLTEVDFNLGIVPMPMYKTAIHTTQDQYYTVQGFWTTLYSVPSNATDKAFSSFVLEALASDAYRHLTPTWYETMFQSRFLQTPENAEMFNVIHDGIIFDAARIFGTHIGNFSAFRRAATSKHWTVYFDSQKGAWEELITEINTSLGE